MVDIEDPTVIENIFCHLVFVMSEETVRYSIQSGDVIPAALLLLYIEDQLMCKNDYEIELEGSKVISKLWTGQLPEMMTFANDGVRRKLVLNKTLNEDLPKVTQIVQRFYLSVHNLFRNVQATHKHLLFLARMLDSWFPGQDLDIHMLKQQMASTHTLFAEIPIIEQYVQFLTEAERELSKLKVMA